MEELFKTWSSLVALGVEAAAAGIIALASIEATWQAVRIFVSRPGMPDAAKESVRLRLARWLAVALEFALAADILRTAIAPSWDEIGKLAAIAALRTILNWSGTKPSTVIATAPENVVSQLLSLLQFGSSRTFSAPSMTA